MKTRKLCKQIDFIKYMTIGLSIGLIMAYVLDIHFINGICIGISLGVLLEKLIQEKKLLLAIYILTGLLIGGLLGYIFVEDIFSTTFGMSSGMLLATVIYLLIPYNKNTVSVKKENEYALLIDVVLGILIGGVIGYLVLEVLGISIGIGLGMIIGILLYMKRFCKTLPPKIKSAKKVTKNNRKIKKAR